MTRALLEVTAVIETAAGILLALWPAALDSVPPGFPTGSPGALLIARVAGVALISLGVACWRARHDGRSAAAGGLIAGMTIYNIAVVAVLAHAGLGPLPGLWPAAALHSVMAVWCLACLWSRRVTR